MENVITKSLGVLQEQGIYALMLFLFSHNSNDTKIIYKNLVELLNNIELKDKNKNDISIKDEDSFKDNKTKYKSVNENKDYFQYVLDCFSDNILDDFDKLFLVRDIYEQTLIYARYGAKALNKANKMQNPTNISSDRAI